MKCPRKPAATPAPNATSYAHVKVGDYFVTVNHGGTDGTAFHQDNEDRNFAAYVVPNGRNGRQVPGKRPRPTRLNDGCFLGFGDKEAVRLVTRTEAIANVKAYHALLAGA